MQIILGLSPDYKFVDNNFSCHHFYLYMWLSFAKKATITIISGTEFFKIVIFENVPNKANYKNNFQCIQCQIDSWSRFNSCLLGSKRQTQAEVDFILNRFLIFRSPSCVTFMFKEKSFMNLTSPVLLSCGIGPSGTGFSKNSQIGFQPSLTCQTSKSSFGTVLFT